jgi:Tfp pilus assembly protein PilV
LGADFLGQMVMKHSKRTSHRKGRDLGFTILEMAIATVVLLVGIVGVMQLIPATLQSNTRTRQDTTATVIGQRILEQLALQQLSAASFTDSDGTTLNLGNPATPGIVVGSPLVAGTAAIDFSQATVGGYNVQYSDPSNTGSGVYDVRWAVITTSNGGNPVAKRFVVGVRQRGVVAAPVYFDTTVAK